jgi:hypothetical protein
LAHFQPGKRPEGYGVFQVKSQFLVGQFPVLFQKGTAKHLLGRHAVAASIRPPVFHQVPKNQVQDTQILVQDLGNSPQLPGHFISGHQMQKIPLWLTFLAHRSTSKSYLSKLNQTVTPNKITLSELKRDGKINFYLIISSREPFRMRTI